MSTNTLYNQQIFATYFTPGSQSGIGIDPQEILNAQLADSLAVLVFSLLAMGVGLRLMKLCEYDKAVGVKNAGLASTISTVLVIASLFSVGLEVRTISKIIFSPNVVIYEATKSLTK